MILAILLGILQPYSPLGFHTLIELFSIVICYMMFAFAFAIKNYIKNNFLIFLSCAYLWIGSLDMLHTLTYPGMNIFDEGSTDLTLRFWIPTRYFESLILLMASYQCIRRINPMIQLFIGGIIFVGITYAAFMNLNPTYFVNDVGLTNFKVFNEYIIISILAIAAYKLYHIKGRITNDGRTLILLAILFTMAAELFFTFYVEFYSISSMLGHICKLFSFWFIYCAVIKENIQQPYRKLQESNLELNRALSDLNNHKYVLDEHAVVTMTDHEGKIIYVNNKFIELSKYTEAELLGQNHRLLKSSANEESLYKEIWNDISNSKIWQGDICNKAKDGSYYWLNSTIAPMIDKNNKIYQYVAISSDITHTKQTEDALRRSQKMDAIGELTGGIAHDFNNLLGIIMGNIELAKMEQGGSKVLQQRLNNILDTAKRGSTLTRKLLSFAKQTPETHKPVNINKTILNLKELMMSSLTNNIDIELDLTDDIWLTDIDDNDFQDSIINLALNAKDAMSASGHGRLIIETSNLTINNGMANYSLRDMPIGDYIEIDISDNGCGMDKDTTDRIYEPFFSMKDYDRGTGLGLAMVYGFVKRSKGKILVYSEVGVGTTFRLFFPRSHHDEIEEVTPVHTSTFNSIIGTETILIVEDEHHLVDVAEEVLNKIGYKTITANTGHEAIQKLENHKIDLVVTDVIMPGQMTGFQLADFIEEKYPTIKILLTSGFTGKMVNPINAKKWHSSLLLKPYQISELTHSVQTLLNNQVIK